MPTYDYSCHTCGTRFDVLQSFSEDTLERCPEAASESSPASCTQPGKGQVSKIFSVPSITFKGDGFYRNDSRSGSKSSLSTESSSDSKRNGDNKRSDSNKSDTTKSDSDSSKSSSKEPAKTTSPSSSD